MTAAPAGGWDAGTVAAEIAARVRDHVLSTGTGDFTAAGLGMGASGATLLLSELSKGDPGLRTTVHALLAAEAGFAGAKGSGLITGLAGLGLATKHAARSPRDYATVRGRVDAALRHRLGKVLDAEYDRMEFGVPGAERENFDVVAGVTGLGRYFLAEPSDPEAIHDVLRYLVALTEPVKATAGPLPGWFSPPWPAAVDPRRREWVLDLGLAHGIAGPLALLSLCWTRGLRVPGHDTAIRRIARWLMSWRQEDPAGPGWPGTVSADQELAPVRPALEPGRASWCYGAPGIARALHLAGVALGEEAWAHTAAEAMRAVFARPDGLRGLDDPGLCHGLAGLARITGRMADELDDPSLSARADEIAERLCARFDPGTAFGFPTAPMPSFRPEPLDAPTFLEGAAGVALVLLGRSTPPAGTADDDVPWDAALLLA
ncbi:lanthionine synthetase C family protein [Streptomyces rugosispiralis]|uniref:Lanthionine synthetase C family protein n=1 Tax=Streptomyces rugosispiralis TaxID=2967341 RepID=A0ABT1UY30_9ACTN|nr:lanthionine synthetase C family protein [Streptomyces rugosispiralis]MCQ8190024.1 lanthionine synthetase C family protein [Streptomyces rugosispiralis]